MKLSAQRVRRLREQAMLSQQEVADEMGTSLYTIQRIERGAGGVRPRTGRQLAAVLGVAPQELLEEQAAAPKKASAPPSPPTRGDAERRTLYLSFILDEARELTKLANWMLQIESFGENPAELTGWSWKITDHLSRVWALQNRWETHLFAPVSEQVLPDWEHSLLEQITEELALAEVHTAKARERFSRELNTRDEHVQQEVERGIAKLQSYIATEQRQVRDTVTQE